MTTDMKNYLILFFIFCITPAYAADLNGVWRGDRGGKFYVQFDRGQLYWYAEQLTRNPAWAHIFQGNLQGNNINGRWINIPKGKLGGAGQLNALLDDDGQTITIRSRSFVATKLRKVSNLGTPARVQHKPVVPASIETAEDCIVFKPGNVQVKNVNGRWKLVDGNNGLFDFDRDRDAAIRARDVIRYYRMDQVCYVGRPDASLVYLTSEGKAPLGKKSGEDCVAFNPQNLKVEQIRGRWKLADGNHWVFDFGNNINEAKQSLELIRRYQFRYSCFVGRPNPDFTYLRQ
jgi:hypothetical protein